MARGLARLLVSCFDWLLILIAYVRARAVRACVRVRFRISAFGIKNIKKFFFKSAPFWVFFVKCPSFLNFVAFGRKVPSWRVGFKKINFLLRGDFMSDFQKKFIVTTFKFSRKKFSELKEFLSNYGLSLSALFNVTLDFWLASIRSGDFESTYSDFLKKYEGPVK